METTTGRILVVDDQDTLREMVADVLAEAGYRVDRFDGGTRALEFLESGPRPNLILLDLLLKADLNGWQFADLVRKNPRLREIPIVAITGASLTPDQVRQLKADLLMRKPFDVGDLLAVVGRFIGPPPEHAVALQ